MKSIIPFILGVLLTCLVAYFGGSNYVSSISDEYKDSLKVERDRNAFKIDSFSVLVDSLNNRKLEKDTVLMKIYRDEKIYINSVDTIHSDSLKSAVLNLLRY